MNIYTELKLADTYLYDLYRINIDNYEFNNTSFFNDQRFDDIRSNCGLYLSKASTSVNRLCENELYQVVREYYDGSIIEVNLIVPLLDEADPIAKFTEYFSNNKQQNILDIELTIYQQIDSTIMTLDQTDIMCEYFIYGESNQMIGQTDSNTRLTHLPTGLVIESLARSRYMSYKAALARLTSKLYAIQNYQVIHLII